MKATRASKRSLDKSGSEKTNEIVLPAKIEIANNQNNEEEKTQDENLIIELPENDSNQNNVSDDIKQEPILSTESITFKIPESEDQVKMKRIIEEPIENPEIKKLKTDENEQKRRRSLRNETAASIKKKPPKYEEVVNCYKRKEYKECIIYIDLVSETAKDWIEYQILKAACLIHLNIKIFEAHKILDDILKSRPDNVFTVYAKGLAYYHEEKWAESIKFFERAVALDKPSMQRAEMMMKIAKKELEKQQLDQKPTPIEDVQEEEHESEEEVEEEESDLDVYSDSEVNLSKDIINKRNKRFGCELCGKYFGKKFNLDRHNKTIHNRETPYIAPLPRNYNRKSTSEKVKTEEDEVEKVIILDQKENIDDDNDEDFVDIEENTPKQKSSKFKIRLGGGGGKAKSLTSLVGKNGMARCKVCKKIYRKGSLARHEVIHSGIKQHKCDQCEKSFYQKSDLQRHVTIHSDCFDFECELCDKKFRIKKNLQVHNKRHHSNLL